MQIDMLTKFLLACWAGKRSTPLPTDSPRSQPASADPQKVKLPKIKRVS